MPSTLRRAYNEARTQLSKVLPFALSHHPFCKPFKGDMVKIFNVRLCKGCVVSYSTVVLIMGIFLLFYDLFQDISILEWHQYILLGLVLGSGQVIRAIFPTISSWTKTLVKFCLGLGIASIFIGIVEIPISGIGRVMVFLATILLYMILGGYLRMYYMKKVCINCMYKREWHRCPGFKRLYK